jgi:outer membrane biosynthesis protein TonB
MKKLSSILFLGLVLAISSCKNEKAADATSTDATTVAPDAAATAPAADATTPVPADAPAVTTVDPNAPTVPTTESVAKPTGPITSMQFEKLEYDYGTVKAGEKVKYSYKFKNTGKEPLIISNAKGSCGCTVPDWPREPIAPGKTGEIKVEFDSTGKGTDEGSPQSKRVTIDANTDPVQTYLTIKGIVKN